MGGEGKANDLLGEAEWERLKWENMSDAL